VRDTLSFAHVVGCVTTSDSSAWRCDCLAVDRRQHFRLRSGANLYRLGLSGLAGLGVCLTGTDTAAGRQGTTTAEKQAAVSVETQSSDEAASGESTSGDVASSAVDSAAAGAAVSKFIADWSASGGAERANFPSFAHGLCDILGVPHPEPTKPNVSENAYVFERDVEFHNLDGSTSVGRIDLYKRGCLVLEAKQGTEKTEADADDAFKLTSQPKKKTKRGTAVRGTKGWDDAMVKARGQAEQYARALPTDEGWPPFLIVVDVGHSDELLADFTRSGKTYLPSPDPGSFRIRLEQLAEPGQREKLWAVWTDPLSLDPSRRSARVTRELADRLPKLAKSLKASGHEAGQVSHFLMRCLFTMFAEDVELIPADSLTDLLTDDPYQFFGVEVNLPATLADDARVRVASAKECSRRISTSSSLPIAAAHLSTRVPMLLPP